MDILIFIECNRQYIIISGRESEISFENSLDQNISILVVKRILKWNKVNNRNVNVVLSSFRHYFSLKMIHGNFASESMITDITESIQSAFSSRFNFKMRLHRRLFCLHRAVKPPQKKTSIIYFKYQN